MFISYLTPSVPTIVLNQDDTINKVTWVYRAARDNVSDIDPQVVVDSVELQISMSNTDDRYLSGNLAGDTQEHVLETQSVSWSNVQTVALAYNDVYGNHNVIFWENKQDVP